MLKLRKYFYPYILPFILAVICIFGQAQTELSLPDYMSDIVSNGIQAGGFKNAVSPVLSPTTYNHLIDLSSKKNARIIRDSYRYTSADHVSKDYKKTFPKAHDLYVLKDGVNKDHLNDAMMRGMLIISNVSGNKKGKSYKKMKNQIDQAVSKAESGYNKGLKKYNEGKKKFDAGKKKYKKGVKGYKKGLAQYQKGLKAYQQGQSKLNQAATQLKKGQAQYALGVKKYNAGVTQYQQNAKKLAAGQKAYQKGLKAYNKGQKQYKQLSQGVKGYNQLKKSRDALNKQAQNADAATKIQLNAQMAALDQQLNTKDMKKLAKAAKTLPKMKSQMAASKKKLDATGKQLRAGQSKLKAVQPGLAKGKSQLAASKAKLDAGQKKLTAGQAQMAKTKTQLAAVKTKLDAAKKGLDKAKKGIDSGEKNFKKAKNKLNDGKSKIDEMKTAADQGDMYYFIDQMNNSQKDKMFSSIDKQMKKMGTSTMDVAGGAAVKQEYKRLGADTDKVQNDYIRDKGLLMLAIALFDAIVTILAALLASRIGAGVARDLRLALFKKVESFSNHEMDQFSTASLITRSTNDITQIQMVVVLIIRMVVYAPILGLGALFHVLDTAPSMTWIIGLVIVAILILLAITLVLAMPKFKSIQKLIDKLNLSMRENLTGVLVIRAFGNEKESEHRFDLSNKDLTKVSLFINRVMACLVPVMMFIMNGINLLIVYYGAHQIDKGHIQIGDMMAFMQYAMMIIMAFLMIAMIFIFIPRASVSASRIAEVLNTTPDITEPEKALPFHDDEKGTVVFNDVSFNYPGSSKPALSHISFVARPGETIAFIGSTGSGKSTLINLIPRFYDVTEGEVLVDGDDVRNADLYELRERIGVVPQKGQLFMGTIKSNVLYGAKNDQYLEDALRISQSEEFIDKLPQGVDSPIAQGGTNVSGGQRQRLAIARAIAKNPEILIFDDSFSALDFKTDAKVRKELHKMAEKTHNTVLIVGQRIASIMDADQIIVLDQGQIVGMGTHQELLKNCKVYQEIAYSQLSKEELDHE